VFFRNEAHFNFSHPSLPQHLAFYENEHELVFITRFKEGLTLDVYWEKLGKRERIPFLIELFKQLTEIYKELDELGIVHGDLKPSNILIAENRGAFQVHLLDFGLALTPKTQQERGTLFALAYSAPEIILGKYHLVTKQTDLFSLACIIYRLYTKSLPFAHPNPAIMTNLQLTHSLLAHPQIPSNVFPILSKMSAKYPFEKPPQYFTEEEVLYKLQQGMKARFTCFEDVVQEFVKISENERTSWFSKLPFLRK